MAVEARVHELLAAGDQAAAATEAIRAMGPPTLRYLRGLLRDEGDAKDAFSHWAEGLWTGLPAFRGQASLRTWSFRLAYNAALDVKGGAWRRRGRRLATREASELAESIRTSTVIRVERRRRVLEALRAELSVEDQTLLTLRIDQGLSWSEIAAVLSRDGTPADVGTIAKRFERLKARLAELVKKEGLGE